MRTLQRLLLCLLCLAPGVAAQSGLVGSIRLDHWAQDSTGQVWGIGASTNTGLYRWEGDKWNFVAVEGVSGGSRPAALATGPDGAVYCLWSAGESEHTTTWHKGSTSKTLAHFTGDLSNPAHIFVDPNKNIWITERGIHIYRITPQGSAECVYTIEYDHRYDSNQPSGARLNFASVFATADGQGRVWFWAGGAHGGGLPSLDGILTFDGKKFDLHSDFPGPPNKLYTAIEPGGPDHMWMAGTRDHLYRVDTQTLIAEVVPEPASNAFRFVQNIFHAGGATYVLTAEGSMPVAERSGEGRIGALWRLQDGKWKRVVNGVDMRPPFSNDPPRSFVETPAGLWLGAYGTGPWFIPANGGEPVHIDWRYGFFLEDSEGLMGLPSGRLLVVAPTGTTTFKPADLLAAFQAPADVQTLNPLRVLVSDRQNHLWGFLSGDRKVISEWDGKNWTEHALPENLDPMRLLNLDIDSQDRIWLRRDACQGMVSIFDPRTGNVETHPDFPDTLQAQLASSASFYLHGNRLTAPAFTPDGRIGYRDACSLVHYFDGRRWQSWRAEDIDPARQGGFDGPASFDRAGNFAVNVAGRTWEYSSPEGWRITTYEKGLETNQEGPASQPPPPPGCKISHADSVVQDRLGTYWLTSQGQLYRAVSDLCVPQFSPGEHQPFGDSRRVKTVIIDRLGNAFLEAYFRTHPNIEEYVIINARPPLPQTKLQATVDEAGSLKLQFKTQLEGKVWFTWKIDGGEWTAPTPNAETTLNWLAEGKHTVEAAALDERLQIDPNPPTAEVTIHVVPQAQLAALIKQLQDSDYSMRDAAVAALARQPNLALPMLKAARENADADQRWWIDAAIQQIQDRLTKKKQP